MITSSQGLTIAFIAVFCVAICGATKKQLADRAGALAAIWFSLAGGVVLGLIYFGLFGWPQVDLEITFSWLPLCATMGIFCEVTYVASIRGHDLSLAIPFKTSNVLFSSLMAWLLLGETVSLLAVIGMLLIAAGGYLLLWKRESFAWWLPLRRVFSEKASRYMLASMLVFSMLAACQKQAAISSSPLFFLFSIVCIEFVVFSCWCFLAGQNPVAIFREHKSLCLRLPVLWTFSVGLLYVALNAANISTVSAIMQLEVLISLALARHLLKEKESLSRLPAACIMLLGAVLAVFY